MVDFVELSNKKLSLCEPLKDSSGICSADFQTAQTQPAIFLLKSNPHVHVVGGGNRQSSGLLGRVMYGGKLTFPGRYGSHEGLPGSSLKRAG